MKWMPLIFLLPALLQGCGGEKITAPEQITCSGMPGSINNEKWNDLAVRSGYCGMNQGLSEFISSVKSRETDLEKSKGYLFWPSENDDGFVSIQVLEDAVLYSFDPSKIQDCQDFDECDYAHPAIGTKLLVTKIPSQSYFDNQMLNMDDLYEFRGVTSYETVTGATSQAFVFISVSRDSLAYKK